MRYWSIVIFYSVIFIFIGFNMLGCTYNVEPNQTTVEYSTSENGKNKINKGIKQTFKWSRR